MGSMGYIPKGESYEFILHVEDSINEAMEKWGKILLKKYNKGSSYRKSDFSINYLG